MEGLAFMCSESLNSRPLDRKGNVCCVARVNCLLSKNHLINTQLIKYGARKKGTISSAQLKSHSKLTNKCREKLQGKGTHWYTWISRARSSSHFFLVIDETLGGQLLHLI